MRHGEDRRQEVTGILRADPAIFPWWIQIFQVLTQFTDFVGVNIYRKRKSGGWGTESL